MPATLARHVTAVAVALVLVSGSAYAGGRLAANSVGSPQIKNGSVSTKDVRDRTLTGTDVKDGSLAGADVRDGSLAGADVQDGSLARADLAKGQVPRVHTVIRRLAEGETTVLAIPGFSRFDVTCSASSITLNVRFGDADPTSDDPTQQHGIAGSDIGDNNPKGGATVTGFAGGVGFSTGGGTAPGSGVLVRGDYWGRSAELLAHGTFAWGFPTVPCLFQLQVIIEELPVPVPLERPAGRRDGTPVGSTCEVDGTAAYCLPTKA